MYKSNKLGSNKRVMLPPQRKPQPQDVAQLNPAAVISVTRQRNEKMLFTKQEVSVDVNNHLSFV